MNSVNFERHRRTAGRAFRTIVERGSDRYDRTQHLPRVLPVGPAEIADETESGRRRIVARLARALRAERARGRGGHWTYDLNRHIALAQAYAAERQHLKGGAGSAKIAR